MKKTIDRLTIMLLLYCVSLHATAQVKGTHLLGDAGLGAGTQTSPSLSLAVPAYIYTASNFKNDNGDVINKHPDLTAFVTGVGVSVVTNVKILGGNWGASALVGFASNKIDGSQVYSKSPLSFTDTYVQPVQLGWKTARADFVAGYALYLPTGRYTLGADDNTGLGITTNEFSGGTTLYLDAKKQWNFSLLASYALNSKKKNTDIKPGDLLSLEGGLAKTWYIPVAGTPIPRVINLGMVYYIQTKSSRDKIPITDAITYTGTKDHIYALGAEGNILFPKSLTAFSFRWLGEFGASNRFQGNTFFITIGQNLKLFTPHTKPAAKQ
ncbi:SphA family protein [Deminuibacter soli]|uniref:Transporter n=1 Tax=Deminuibacter soli TaxID=2291815 RepID=A0A3E1NH96_9BACT|nr:transporter [Deminuibacter soli]RFM27305.1 transporter [Deminuibacter soli]